MQHRAQPRRARTQRGISLIITLIMLVIIGLTAGAAMRSAVSSEKVINNMRSETLAQQYAEIALRYCERQMAMPSAARTATRLQEANLGSTVPVGVTPTWQATGTWHGSTPRKTIVPDLEFANANSSFTPRAPECHVERQALNDGTTTALVVTARGFSPDYAADTTTGETTAGSVVWLQTITGNN